MHDLWTALALMLVIEGVLYALFPEPMRRALAVVLSQPPTMLRVGGLGAAVAGVAWVWLLRH
jgi:uncharacterized protein YjeT (DUF2065 family)